MTAQQMWKEYAAACGAREAYDAWAFGADADALAALVLRAKDGDGLGQPLYEAEHAPLPQPGSTVWCWGQTGRRCASSARKRWLWCPSVKWTQAHAFREGEGDKSLAFWRRGARGVLFAGTAAAGPCLWARDMKVVCEEFRVVWPPDAAVRKEVPV